MLSLEDLIDMAINVLVITIKYEDLHSKRPTLDGYADAGNRLIVLDISLRDNPRHHKCVLAEEIGHILFPPRPGHLAYHMQGYYQLDSYDRSSIKAVVSQDERKAIQWATIFLIPDIELDKSIADGKKTIYEFAEIFEVEKWFMLFRLNFYKRQNRQNGRKTKLKDIVIRK